MKRKQCAAYCFLLFSLYTAPLFADRSSSYLLLRTYYPTDEVLAYESIYLYYRLHYVPAEDFVLNFAAVKGCREPGYYPGGYIQDVGWGLYEKGSYYLYLKDKYNFNKIIVGNYVPLFGQGILFGGTFPVILSNPYYDLARYRDTLNPTSTVSKTILLEGIALEYLQGDLAVRPFISWNAYDCTAGESSYYLYDDNDGDGIPNDEDDDDFTGIGQGFPPAYSCKNDLYSCICGEPDYEETGDRSKRNNLSEYLFGLNLSTGTGGYNIGGTVTFAFFNRLIDPYYNYDPDKGDKTGHCFRGDGYAASSVYFKLYEPIEVFGEVVGSVNRKRSYYPEFYGGYSAAIGLSGGIRGHVNGAGLIGWGAYLPANLVNPHAGELPDGRNNLVCGLIGMNASETGGRLSWWIYAYKELYSADCPGNTEKGFSHSYRATIPCGGDVDVSVSQNHEAIDGYYIAPETRSYKITSKLAVKKSGGESDLLVSLENRLGGPALERLRVGNGIKVELRRKQKERDWSVSAVLYVTENDRYAYIYPYERSFAGWGFLPSAVKGQGITGAGLLVQRFETGVTLGARVKYRYDFLNSAYNGLTVYLLSKVQF